MKKILIVEDNTDSMEILERALSGSLVVLKAYDGKEGVEMCMKEKPDIILMDINLPVMDGLEAVRRIKREPSVQDIPIVAISADVMASNRKKAMKAGCIDFIPRPVRPRQLKKRLLEIVGD